MVRLDYGSDGGVVEGELDEAVASLLVQLDLSDGAKLCKGEG